MECHNWPTNFGVGLIPYLTQFFWVLFVCIVNKYMFLIQTVTLCFYKAMRSQVESFLRDHLVIGKQVLGRKWNATIDQIHCQKRRLLILLQYFFFLKLPTYKKHILIIHLPILNKSVLYWITKHGGTLNKVCWKWCRRISKYPNF